MSSETFQSARGNRRRGLVVPFALLLMWSALGKSGLGSPQIFVAPTAVLGTLLATLGNGTLPLAILATVLRALAGFALGALSGLLMGAVLGLHGPSRRVVAPTLNGLRQIALFAWIPLMSAWLGTGETMKIALIALGAFFPMLLNTEAGCRGVPQPYLEVGRLLEFGRRTRFFKLILPAASGMIVSGLEIAFATAWLGTIGTEYLIGTGYVNGFGDGLGVFLAAGREYGRMDQVTVGIIALALTGLALDRLMVYFCKRLMPWQTH